MIQGRDVVTLDTFSPEELRFVIERAREMKTHGHGSSLQGRSLVMVFFDPSLRTRASFSIAFSSLGGTVIDMVASRDIWALEMRDGAVMDGVADEHVRDAAAVLSEYADVIAIRALARHDDWARERRDQVIVSFQKYASVPIFNMESVLDHPCQAWGDALTLTEEFGDLAGQEAGPRLDLPPPDAPARRSARRRRDGGEARHGRDRLPPRGLRARPRRAGHDGALRRRARAARVRWADDPRAGVEGADVVYAASWGSTLYHGRPDDERDLRRRHRDWRDHARPHGHEPTTAASCTPCRSGATSRRTTTSSTRPTAACVPQAGNRLHIQRALFAEVLKA